MSSCYKGTGTGFSDDVSTESSQDPAAEDWEREEVPPFDAPDRIDGIDVTDVLFDPDTEDWTDTVDSPAEPDAQELPPGLVWVSIPAGTFEMGCSPGDGDCRDDGREEPRHTVNVPAFEMTGTEITQAQYFAVTGESPSYHAGCAGCPVEQVNWNQAKAFCEAIGGRLPSEAEWEFAARGGTTTRYYCGDDAACLDAVAWYSANSGSKTHPAGEKTANAFSLYDMLGNVWEWVEDCWHADYTGAPADGGVWRSGSCVYLVLRGGSWNSYDVYLRVSYRPGLPSYNRYSNYGFRCVR